MRKLLVLIAGLIIVSSSHAGSTYSTTVDKILLYDGGMLIYVYPTGGVSNPPACHGSNGDYYSFSMTRPMAKEYLGALLTAQARGVAVDFYGAGACTDQSVSETLMYFTVH